jgi:ParB-like nuclease domain
MSEMSVVEVPVKSIAANENIRYGLKATRIDTLAADIAVNGLMSPVEVEEADGGGYRLTTGHYRLAAIAKLNKEGAGIETVTAIIHPSADAVSRMKRQLSENLERETMSPMDKASAIRKLFDAGVPRIEIRQLFASPGGRKGLKVQPASNSFVNMMLTFLEFTKDIKEKIHDGRLTVGASYKLHKAPREKWEDILAEAEKSRQDAIDQEEKDEKKYIEAEGKAREAQEKADKIATDHETAKIAVT